jgi:hypothetical protein
LKGKRREKRERVKAGEAGEGFMSIVRFEDLECWQRAVDLAVKIYK